MPKIDFYILESDKQRAYLFACRLVENLFKEKKPVYIHTESASSAELIDNLLWTYRDDSFLPHGLYRQENKLLPILIGYDEIPLEQKNTLINLHTEIPNQFQQFQHIIEIVFSDPLVQQCARNRYKQYRDQGIELITHKEKNELT